MNAKQKISVTGVGTPSYFLSNHGKYVQSSVDMQKPFWQNDIYDFRSYKHNKLNLRLRHLFPRGYHRMLRRCVRRKYFNDSKTT
jgi:hypothetical protein